MGRPELGAKLTCADCSVRFYDLNRSPVVCPSCGAAQATPKLRSCSKPIARPGWRSRKQAVPVAAVAEAVDDGNAIIEADVDGDEDEDAAEADADPDAEVESTEDRDAA